MIAEPPTEGVPAWASDQRVLLRGGSVYSAADPFATALLVHGPTIAWVGGDGAALALADGVDEVVDLDGALLTPAFVSAAADEATDSATAARAGTAALTVLAGPERVADLPGPLLRPQALTPVESLTAELLNAASPGSIAVRVPTPAALGEVLARMSDAGTGSGLVLIGAPAVTGEQVAALAAAGCSVVLQPDPATGLRDVPLADLAAAGVPLAFGSVRDLDPWATIRSAVHHADPAQRISARAAFAAHTRGGWRAAGQLGVGTLVPGAPAHYAIWEVADLVVEAPDDRIQAWSTDPRSGTPGLPDLSIGAVAPRCERTAVWGRRIA